MHSKSSPAAASARVSLVRAGLALCLAFTVYSAAPASLFAQKTPATEGSALQPGSIEGSLRIKDSGKPAANVAVTIRETNQTVTTDDKGRYVFPSVVPGTYTLVATGEGYGRTRITDVVVRPGSDLTLSRQTIVAKSANQEPLELEDFVVSAKSEGVLELDPYTVEGSKPKPFSTANIDLTRTKDDVLPFNVFTAKEIGQSGALSLAEFFRNRIPQNFQNFIPEESLLNGLLNNPLGAQNSLNFSGGLGGSGHDRNSEMVILVDGRRLPNRYNGMQGAGNITAGDFRSIPIASIERVEYLSSAASAIYGAGATKGVINIITKRDYRGGSISLGYETPMDMHAPNRSAEFYYATPLKWGTSLRVTYAYSDRDPLTLAGRADVTEERGRRIIMQRDPASITWPNAIPLGATTNVYSLGGALFGPGSASFTSVPDGYAGSQGITPFMTRQGVYNLALADGGIGGDWGKNSRLGAVSNDTNIGVGLDKNFGEKWRGTVEYRRTKNVIHGSTHFEGANGTAFFVPANAPTNPFGVDVLVKSYDSRLARPELADEFVMRSEQFTATLRGEIHGWMTIFDASYIRDKEAYRRVEFSGPLGGGFGPAVASGLYNPFVDMRTTAPAPASFYEEYEQNKTSYGGSTDNYQFSAKTSGALFALPAGDLQLTAGVEWLAQDRGDSYHVDQYAVNSKTGGGGFTLIDNPLPNSVKSFSSSIYSEVNVPLISGRQSIPLVKRLEFFASGRISRQSLEGNKVSGVTTNTVTDATGGTTMSFDVAVSEHEYKTTPYIYAAGLRYDIMDGVAFRVSRSIGFRPPAFSQIVPGVPNTSSQTEIASI